MHLTRFESQLYIAVTASVAGAIANKGKADKPGHAHMAQDRATAEVHEWRTRARTARLLRQRRARR